ncbi:MAG: hypothetical protein CM15mP83_2240 [Flavobacteriaceae bacterium]|nr:MAG: hypothetical protein CM15mP83_2240 [Flavobacteriaceae bacterium]
MNDSFYTKLYVRFLTPIGKRCVCCTQQTISSSLTQTIISQLKEPTIAPEILDIDSFICSLSNMEAPPKMELLFTLYQSYCQHVDPNDRDDFVRF